MSVREYIGARYVPMFADPIEWDDSLIYEPLTVVKNQGASYVSRREVPEGIPLDNEDYWILWADFNAQLQHYIDIVNTFDTRIDTIEDNLPIADFSSANTVKDVIDALGALLPTTDFSSANTVKDVMDALGALLPTTDFSSANTVKDVIDALGSLLPTTEFDSTHTVKDALTPSTVFTNDFSNLQETSINGGYIEYDSVGDKLVNVANPNRALSGSYGAMTNPLPILQMTNGYRLATNIKYGNEYTATNLNSNYDGWEPAYMHMDDQNKMNIDCTTFVILVMMGIFFGDSTYTNGKNNVGINYCINMFTPEVRKYIELEDAVLGEQEFPPHRRILSSVLGKMIHDRGELVKLVPHSNAAGLATCVAPGDILFHSNHTPEDYLWENIGHCSIVVSEIDGKVIIIDSSTNRGGANDTVNYHILTDSEAQSIKWKYTPHETLFPLSLANNAIFVASQDANQPSTVTFSQAGYLVAYNNSGASETLEIVHTYPAPVNAVTEEITLANRNSILRIVPPGVSIKCTATGTATYKFVLGCHSINAEPYLA